MPANIYALTNEAENLYNLLLSTLDEETGEVDTELANALEVKKEEFAVAATNYATVIRALKAKKSEAEAEIARISGIKDKLDKIIERMTNGLSTACRRLEITEVKGLHASVSFRKSEQTVIDDFEMIPKEYIKEKVTYSADKAAIKAAIKAGATIDGAHIETVQNIQIK